MTDDVRLLALHVKHWKGDECLCDQDDCPLMEALYPMPHNNGIATMKLYVWSDCFTDYTSGLAFAVAPGVEEARNLVAEAFSWRPEDLALQPKVYDLSSPVAFAVFGGS